MSGIGMMMLGSGGAKVSLGDRSVYASGFAPTATTGGYYLTSGGLVQVDQGLGVTTVDNWVVPGSAGPQYEVFATLTSGTVTTGTTGSWLALSSTRSWTKTRSGTAGISQVFLAMQIRRVGTATVLATANIDITAELF